MNLASPIPSYRWVVMGTFCSMMLVWNLVSMSLGVMLPGMTEELGLTPLAAGWLGAVAFLAMAVLSIPFGNYLSGYSVKVILGLAAVVATLTTFGQGWAPDLASELAMRSVFVIPLVFLRLAPVLLIQQWFQAREYATANGITNGAMNIAQALGLGLTPWLMILVGGWRNAFYFFGGLMLLTTILWLVLAREHLHPEYQTRMAAQEGTPLRALVRYRMLWLLAFCQIGSALAWAAFLTFWPTFAIQDRGLSLITAGYLIGLLPFGSIFGSFLSGILSDRLGVRKPLIWLPGLCLPVCYLTILSTDSIPVLAGVLFFSGFCAFVVVPVIYTLPYELEGIRPREIAVASGLVFTITTFGGGSGPLVAGFLTQATGSLHGALTVCALCAITLGVLPMFLPETGWRAQRRRAAQPSGRG